MKIKNIIGVVALPALLMASAIAFAGAKKAEEAKAETDVGEIAMGEVRNAISNATTIYLLPTQNYDLPDSWDIHYAGVGEEDGIFLNGVKHAGGTLAYAGTGSAFITFYYGLSREADEGDVIEFRGTFAGGGYSFTLNYATQRFANTWTHALEDFDIVSLADANMPNISAGAAINTDDLGSDYNYTTDPGTLPKRKGFFGLTNNTGSYSFQFNHKKTTTGTGWFHVLIGGRGPLWNSGHFIDFGFLDSWATTGHAQIHEMTGKGNNWAADVVQETDAIALNWNVGETNLLEMGNIKVKGSEKHFIFFKVNGALKYGEYWTLADSPMTTKVCLQYAGEDATVTNSIEPASTSLSPSTYVPAAKQLYLNMAIDICPVVNNWDDYFLSADGNGLKLNGSNVGVSNWNYFKKTGATQMFLALGDIGITPAAGDILTIGGMFRAAKLTRDAEDHVVFDSNNPLLYKVNFVSSNFQFDGENWRSVNPDYEASDFAKDLLKLTNPVCSAASEGNHDELDAIWQTLSHDLYYGQLTSSEVNVLVAAEADKNIVVPSTDDGVDAMAAEDAIKAAMYRYDFCTAKYSLTAFIAGRVSSLAISGRVSFPNNTRNSTLVIVIVVTATSSLCLAGLILFRKRRRAK